MDWPILIIVAIAAYSTYRSYTYNKMQWREVIPHRVPLIFLEPGMAIRPTILGHSVPEAYRLSCLFFGTGLIDRTGTLDQGFPYKVLEPIPTLQNTNIDMTALCDARAAELVDISRASNKPIRLFWSGGIDSTAACIALLKALKDDPERLEIIYSTHSIAEYRHFYKEYVKPHPSKEIITTVSDGLSESHVLTSGELGDQLFGSIKALTIPFKTLNLPWQRAFPEILNAQFASPGRTDAVIRYLEPQFDQSPIPLRTLFDLLWWMNFSLKWQAVSLRMLSPLNESAFNAVKPNLHHFFQTNDFQQWTLNNPSRRIRNTWASYKWPLKNYIRDYTNDHKYYNEKEKEPSLRDVLTRNNGRLALAIDHNEKYFYQARDLSLRHMGASDSGFAIEFSIGRENDLWEGMGTGE